MSLFDGRNNPNKYFGMSVLQPIVSLLILKFILSEKKKTLLTCGFNRFKAPVHKKKVTLTNFISCTEQINLQGKRIAGKITEMHFLPVL